MRIPPRGPRLSRRAALSSLLATATVLRHGAAAAEPRPTDTPTKAHPRPRDNLYEVLEVGPGKRFPSLTHAGCFMNSQARWNNTYAGPERTARMGFRLIVSPGPPGYYVNDSGSHSRRWKEPAGLAALRG